MEQQIQLSRSRPMTDLLAVLALLLLLPALVNQLADQAAFVLAALPLELVEAALGFRIQPHSEGHGKDKLGQLDRAFMSYTLASCRTRSNAHQSRRRRSTYPASRAATR